MGFAIVAAAWAFCATRAIELPGVYMDAVNPDYLVARVLNWRREPMTAWVLPGNYLLGARFPILVSLYHGTQHFWLGLPLFWLLGTTVESLRIVHALFGLGVLASLYALLASAGVRPWLATLATGALAIDPVFLFAFRTQSYITMSPAAWLLLALFFPLRAQRDGPARRARSSPAAFSPAWRCRAISSTRSSCPRSSPASGSGRGHGRARGRPGAMPSAGASASRSASRGTCSATR